MARDTMSDGAFWARVSEPALARLAAPAPLSDSDAHRLRAALERLEHYAPGVQVNALPTNPGPKLVVGGWLCELRVLPDGRRHIFSFLIPGDIYMGGAPDDPRSFALLTLTRAAVLDLEPILSEAGAGSSLALAVRRTRQLADERRYDAAVRLGRLNAVERTAHLLLELEDRLAAAGLSHEAGFRLPLSQKHLADALGLSLMQVNRVLKQLRVRALIAVRSGTVTLLQRPQLASLAVRPG